MKYAEILARAEGQKDTEDPRLANTLALDLALVAVDAGAEANRLELDRKDLLTGIRDGIMQAQKMAATPAEAQARMTAQYKEYVEKIQHLTDTSERAKALSRYFAAITTMEAARG